MKRAPLFVIGGTIAGLAGILSFHTSPAASVATTPVTGGAHPGGSSAASGQGTARHGRARARNRARVTRTPSSATRSALGATEQYGYGQLAVKVTARAGRIVSVAVAQIQTAEPYSAQLARQVIPTLRAEVLSGQTANINGISGATYTCEAYAKSVQAALDSLHLR